MLVELKSHEVSALLSVDTKAESDQGSKKGMPAYGIIPMYGDSAQGSENVFAHDDGGCYDCDYNCEECNPAPYTKIGGI